MAPGKVRDTDVLAIWNKMQTKAKRAKRLATLKFLVGQHVRISKEKVKFAKGGEQNYMLVGDTNALLYCDLIEPQFIGTAMARYLATFFVPSVYNNYLFKNIYYVPVEKRTFRDIRIEVLTLSGQRIAIKDSKTTMKVVLHFRRVAPPHTHGHS
jgi:hypothetical protein